MEFQAYLHECRSIIIAFGLDWDDGYISRVREDFEDNIDPDTAAELLVEDMLDDWERQSDGLDF